MSAWQDLVTASLIGTERAPVPAVRIPGLPAGAEPAGEDSAAILLDRAAMAAAARRAGRLADRAEPLPAAEPDSRPAVSPAARGHLVRMLSGEHPDLLTEWLTAVTARGLRPPAQSLPALLDRARRAAAADPGLRHLVTQAGGARARWLAALNPDWKFTSQDPGNGLAGDDAWRLGDAAQRRGYLAALRVRAPDAARELIAGRWDAASAGERVMFLSVLADAAGPGPADEPMLEAALDDRAEDVHSWAAYLLTQLPGSALGRRMAGRARRCLHLKQGRGRYLVTDPPAECDAAMRRDGITPGPGAGRSQLAGRTRLMLEVVARTPLRTWTDAFAIGPAEIVAVPSGDWAPVLFAGWSRAAIAQRDQAWMAALINEALAGRPPGTPAEYGALSQLARRADPALGAPDARPDPIPGAPSAVRDAIRVLRFRYDMLKELNDDHSGG